VLQVFAVPYKYPTIALQLRSVTTLLSMVAELVKVRDPNSVVRGRMQGIYLSSNN